MNLSSLLPAPTASGPQSAGQAAGQSSGSKTSGSFDALVTAKTCVTDGVSPSDETAVSDVVAAVPTDMAKISAATMAMLATLDRSAKMLSQPQGAADSPVKEEKPAATDETSPTDTASTVPSPQAAALVSAFMAVGRASPTIVSLPEDNAQEADAATPLTAPAPKPAPLTLAATTPNATTPAMPALFNAIAAELRPMLSAKADLADKAVDAALQPAKDSPDGVSVVSPTSAMIRDLASMIASNVTASAPTDGVAVDRHLDLARGDAWLNDLANDIAATAANGGRLKFGLAPESLGRLDVEIRQGASGVNVHMMTRTDTARDVLTAAQPRIVDEIRAQGVRVAGTEVSTDASGFGGDRAGSTPRQPLAMSIEAAFLAPNAAPSDNPKAVVDGRYA